MISYEKALKKAKELKPKINSGTETENAYIFGDKTSKDDGNSPVVIMKETGDAKTIIWYILNADAPDIRRFDL